MEFFYVQGDWSIIGNNNPYCDVEKIIGFSDKISSEHQYYFHKNFRYSFDNENWTDWIELIDENLQKIQLYEVIEYTNNSSDDKYVLDTFLVDDVWCIKFSDNTELKIKENSLSPFESITFTDNIKYIYNEKLDSSFFEYLLSEDPEILNIKWCKNKNPRKFWIEYRYELHSGWDTKLESITLNYITFNNTQKYSDNFCTYIKNGGNQLSIINNDCYNPININDSLSSITKLYSDLNLIIGQISGINVVCFKYNPILESEDILFHEYTLYEVENPKDIKIIIPNGKLPDSAPKFDQFDIEWEMPFEIHISFKEWENVFGKTMPQKRDIFWIQKTNKLWEVSSSYIQKELNGINAYYKVFLTKYQHRNNAIKSQEVEEMIDEKILSQESIFTSNLNKEINKIKPLSQYEIDNIHDIRQYSGNIYNYNLLNYQTKISENYYDMNTTSINYNIANIWSKKENRSLSCWFKIPIDNYLHKEKIIIDQIYINPLYSNYIFIDTNDYQLFTTNKEIHIWNDTWDIYGILKYDQNLGVYIDLPINDIDYINSYINENDSYINIEWEYTNRINLLRTKVNSNIEFSIDMILGNNIHKLIIKYKENSYIFNIDKSIFNDEWYGLFINMSNIFKWIDINIYHRLWDPVTNLNKTNKLESIFYNKIENIIPTKFIGNYLIESSNIQLTNIGWRNKTYGLDDHSYILNQYTPDDFDSILFFDNAKPQNLEPLL